MRRLQTESRGKVKILRDVPYVRPLRSSKQTLDVYLPPSKTAGRPMIIHFHGGGWNSGDKAHELFGAPAVARSHAAAGIVCITPSYRLGNAHNIMLDAQSAVLWAVANATALGADPNRLYLSGHSAGGNIAALLGVGPWLAPPILPPGAVKGIVGLSGIYTLQKPLGGLGSCYKNRIFDGMRNETFSEDDLVKYSPSALVRLGGGDASPFKRPWSEVLSKLACDATAATLSVVNITASPTDAPPLDKLAAGPDGVSWADDVPPVLLVNASWDLGLEDDSAYFAKTVHARTGRKPEHVFIPNTNHATVSWDEATFRKCRTFIAECEGSGEEGLV